MFQRILALYCALALYVALAIPAAAQVPAGFLPVSQAKLQDGNGVPISNATVCAAVTVGGSPASVQVGVTGITTFSSVCTSVTNGYWSMNLPDMSLSTPRYACVKVTATDNLTGDPLLTGYDCIQPRSVPPQNLGVAPFWCTSVACDLGLLPPNYPASDAFVAKQGPKGDTGCNMDTSTCAGVVLQTPAGDQMVYQPGNTTANFSSLNRTINPLLRSETDFGAKVNAAIASCTGQESCDIQIPQIAAGSEPLWTTPIVVSHANVSLRGAGKDITNLKYTGAGGTVAIDVPVGSDNSSIRDLTLTGTVETPSSASSYNNNSGIYVEASHVTVDKIHLAHFWRYGSGIELDGSFNILSDSLVEYATFAVFLRGSNHKVTNNTISNHYSQAQAYEDPATHYWDGIAGEGLSQTLIQGNTVYDNGQSGIYTGGNSSVSFANRIIGNEVFNNWNYGIDQGVLGTQSDTNSLSDILVSSNRVQDNRFVNIWMDGINKGSVTGNLSDYTPSYPTYFGARAQTSGTAGIALAEVCTCSTSNVSVTGNTVSDTRSAPQPNISFNVALGTGNVVAANSINQFNYVNPSLDLTKNWYQDQAGVSSPLAKPLSGTGANFVNKVTTTNNYGGNGYVNGSQTWIEGYWGSTDWSLIADPTSGRRPFGINPSAPDGSLYINSDGNLINPAVKALSGLRYVCADTSGRMVSSTTPCSGT